ncbi:hypothetical protein AB8Z38_04600 [Bradyrhizobium sp. LLZ17]|uniref:Uncharacterized protein n=1 Tax=Bradyrhizobium sp. LLZ17 TaxID=3239388 RepID=A0AB39XPL2_9BRAD
MRRLVLPAGQSGDGIAEDDEFAAAGQGDGGQTCFSSSTAGFQRLALGSSKLLGLFLGLGAREQFGSQPPAWNVIPIEEPARAAVPEANLKASAFGNDLVSEYADRIALHATDVFAKPDG